MKTYSMGDFQRHTGDIADEAAKEPITLTRYGKPKYVLISHEAYERLMTREKTQHAYKVDEMPADIRHELMEELAPEFEALEKMSDEELADLDEE